jgi:hypothetical protein
LTIARNTTLNSFHCCVAAATGAGFLSQLLPVLSSCQLQTFLPRPQCHFQTVCTLGIVFRFLFITKRNSILLFHLTFPLAFFIVVAFFVAQHLLFIFLALIQASFLPIHQHYILPLAAVLLSDILLLCILG